MRQGVNLVSNNGATNGLNGMYYVGGRSVLVTRATAYGTSQLQYQLSDGTWIPVGAASTADGIGPGMDLPAGQYRMSLSGAQTAMFAELVFVPYS